MIQPSTGRIVLYRHDGLANPEPHAAIVIAVQDDRSVNLACFSPDGTYYHRLAAPLLQDDDAAPAEGGYAEWMPFQKGQAVKTEAAESDLHPRVTELEQLLTTGGPIHALVEGLQIDIGGKLSEVEKGVDGKLQELGAWLVKKFAEIGHPLEKAAAPAADAASQGQPAAPAAAADVSGAGAAPQAQA